MREIVEGLYAYSEYYPSEFLRFCVKNNGKNNPYPAHFKDINGIPWEDRIYCGRNPYLYARKVDDLRSYETENGEKGITWKERPIPNHLKELMRNPQIKSQ